MKIRERNAEEEIREKRQVEGKALQRDKEGKVRVAKREKGCGRRTRRIVVSKEEKNKQGGRFTARVGCDTV